MIATKIRGWEAGKLKGQSPVNPVKMLSLRSLWALATVGSGREERDCLTQPPTPFRPSAGLRRAKESPQLNSPAYGVNSTGQAERTEKGKWIWKEKETEVVFSDPLRALGNEVTGRETRFF